MGRQLRAADEDGIGLRQHRRAGQQQAHHSASGKCAQGPALVPQHGTVLKAKQGDKAPAAGWVSADALDQAEALVAIDVNTGRFTGSKSQEETVMATNLPYVGRG